jgi:hypothetical protein
MIDKYNKGDILLITMEEFIMNNKKMNNTMKNLEVTTFRYYNCNPHHKHTDDCVIRAIATGTQKSWQEVLRDLTEYSINTGFIYNTPELYSQYLSDLGWVKQKQPKQTNGKMVRVKDFIKNFKGYAIIHAGKGHVSFVSDGKVYDIWNCEDEVVGSYWIQKGE